jgi:SAM-dependent methyltransferase
VLASRPAKPTSGHDPPRTEEGCPVTTNSSPESPASWDEVAAGWGRQREIVWRASRELSERLVDLLDPQPGDTVLDVAAGLGDTGFLAARRIEPGGRLLSTDVAPQMLVAAQARAAELGVTNAEFHVMDAQALELEDESVDGVLCRWGYMLVDDPARALAETHRVLQPGGRVAFAVWATPEENVWASAIGRTLLQHGLVERPEPDAPGPFRLADRERLESLVAGAGLELMALENIELTWRYDSFDMYWEVSSDLSRTLAVVLEAVDEKDAARVRADVRSALAEYESEDGWAIPAVSRAVLARRPSSFR